MGARLFFSPALRARFFFHNQKQFFSGPGRMSGKLMSYPGVRVGYMNKQETQRATNRAHEYHVPPFWRVRQDVHFCLLIDPKNIILEEDVRILLSVKFQWIPFSGFRGIVENVSASQRLGGHLAFFDRPEKHKIGRGLETFLHVLKLLWIQFSGFWRKVNFF